MAKAKEEKKDEVVEKKGTKSVPAGKESDSLQAEGYTVIGITNVDGVTIHELKK